MEALINNHFFYPLSIGKENHLKRTRSEHKQQNTCLTAFTYEDLETVLYYATAANEYAGKSLDESRLLPVRLSWWNELEVSTRQQRFSFIRLHGTYLTKFLLCLFP